MANSPSNQSLDERGLLRGSGLVVSNTFAAASCRTTAIPSSSARIKLPCPIAIVMDSLKVWQDLLCVERRRPQTQGTN